jgi:MtN3 and saliva related transmembrane protein
MDFITILGLVAATCTTISFIPQAIKAIRTRHTKDLSLGMYTLLTTGIILWLIYGVFKNDLPIILANGITLVFAATILFLKIKYK